VSYWVCELVNGTLSALKRFLTCDTPNFIESNSQVVGNCRHLLNSSTWCILLLCFFWCLCFYCTSSMNSCSYPPCHFWPRMNYVTRGHFEWKRVWAHYWKATAMHGNGVWLENIHMFACKKVNWGFASCPRSLAFDWADCIWPAEYRLNKTNPVWDRYLSVNTSYSNFIYNLSHFNRFYV